LKSQLIQQEGQMKINNDTRFPYPVLSRVTGDYKEGSFSISVFIEETPSSGKLKVGYTVSLQETKLPVEIENRNAVVGISVTCLETYYNQATILDKTNGSLEFAPGLLKGRVSIIPLIWSVNEIKSYSNDKLHDEYENLSWDFKTGSVLAIGNELIINVGHEKLAPMESIFSLAKNNEVPPGEIKVQADTDNITIHAHPDTYQTINNLRGTKIGQSILLNSIYLPAVMEVLSHLRDGETNFAGKKWYKVFNAKCEHLNIEYKTGNFLDDAQKLLKSPINKIKSIGDELL
jgi:hypothetical protein